MDERGWIARRGFWPLALLWLPAGVVALAVLRFGASAVAVADPGEMLAALGCRRLRRLGYRRAAWTAGIGFGVLTIPAAVFAGLLGPVAIAVWAALLSLPVWIASLWLARHG